MKIQIPSEFRQFQCVPVTCSDTKMWDILSRSRPHTRNLNFLRKENHRGEVFMFNSGAELSMSEGRHRYHIYGYHYAGQDIRDAIAELMVMELAHRQRRVIRKYHSNPDRFIEKLEL